jgi:hypothetical protein
MTSFYESLLEGMESCRWNYLRGLADAAEDEGKADLARGWRWLAKYRKWPMKLWYAYVFEYSGAPLKEGAEHELPMQYYVEVRQALEANGAGTEEEEVQLESRGSLSRFMAVVAEAIGEYLGRPRPQPMIRADSYKGRSK